MDYMALLTSCDNGLCTCTGTMDYMALVIQLELDCQVCTVFTSVGSLVC